MDSVFSQLSVLGSSLVLLFGLILLWRRGVTAYISAFTWQSIVLAAVTAIVAYFGNDHELYWVAAGLLLLKGLVIPRLLKQMAASVRGRAGAGAVREHRVVARGRPACSCCSPTRSRGRWSR